MFRHLPPFRRLAVVTALALLGCGGADRDSIVRSGLDETQANRLFTRLHRHGVVVRVVRDAKTGQVTLVVPTGQQDRARMLLDAYNDATDQRYAELLKRLADLESGILTNDKRQHGIEAELQLWEMRRASAIEDIQGVVKAVVIRTLPSELSLDDEVARVAPRPGSIGVQVNYCPPVGGDADGLWKAHLRQTVLQVFQPEAVADSLAAPRVEIFLVELDLNPPAYRTTQAMPPPLPAATSPEPPRPVRLQGRQLLAALLAVGGLLGSVLLIAARALSRRRRMAGADSPPLPSVQGTPVWTNSEGGLT